MFDDANNAPDEACTELLDFLLSDERAWMDEIVPTGIPSTGLFDGMIGDADGDEVAETSSPPTGLALREAWMRFLGNVVWDVFSGNHDVVGPDDKVYSLGSWRGAGGFLADYLNARLVAELPQELPPHWGPFMYMDFYMGAAAAQREGADVSKLRALYLRLFSGLKARDFEWRFSPPSLGLVKFAKPPAADDLAGYDPSAALADEAARAEKAAAAKKLEREIAEGNAEAYEEAVENPPMIVLAYKEVYGRRPRYN